MLFRVQYMVNGLHSLPQFISLQHPRKSLVRAPSIHTQKG